MSEQTSERIAPPLMKVLIGGEFPDTGFSWGEVCYFQLVDGVWEPYSGFGEILPADGFVITGSRTGA